MYKRQDPKRLERSTRDIVARAGYLEAAEGRGGPNGGVLLDVSHLGAEFVEKNFRGMVKRCRDFGWDLARQPVEVMPTAHFMMGGVCIKPDCRTELEGLFAAGEDAGGIHGANRLGGNGVADSTVFGGIAGDGMADWVLGRSKPAVSWAEAESLAVEARSAFNEDGPEHLYAVCDRMREVMWEHMGLMREESGLLRVLSEVATLRERAARAGVKGGPAYNLAWQHWLNLRNQLLVSELIARSALARRESRGSHYRRDFPEPDPAWLANVLVRAGGECVKVWTAPVGFTRYTPDGRPAIAVSVETR